MKLILLAAGRGTRISRYLDGKPKCTVSLGDLKLIEYTVDLFRKNGIQDISMVLGYEGQYIIDLLNDEEINYFYNPFYDVTNSVGSLWFAKDHINEEDTLIMNADVFLEQSTLDIILGTEASPVLFADSSRKEEGDYKFKYSNGVLEKYGKELTGDDITGEYVGIAKMNSDFMPIFKDKMLKLVETQNHGLWWENILYTMVEEREIYVKEVTGNFWAEVDYVEDYERIMEFVKNNPININE